jgi:hypothetical protein
VSVGFPIRGANFTVTLEPRDTADHDLAHLTHQPAVRPTRCRLRRNGPAVADAFREPER